MVGQGDEPTGIRCRKDVAEVDAVGVTSPHCRIVRQEWEAHVSNMGTKE